MELFVHRLLVSTRDVECWFVRDDGLIRERARIREERRPDLTAIFWPYLAHVPNGLPAANGQDARELHDMLLDAGLVEEV